MSSFRKLKEEKVLEIEKLINDSKSFVIAEYHGLTVDDLQELRKQLKTSNIQLKVFKNRLFKLAISKKAYTEIDDILIGPNIFAFSKDDEIAPAKIIYEFAKTKEALKLKAGIYEGNLLVGDAIMSLAKLPSMYEALTMLATSLLAPVRYIGSGLYMIIKEEKVSLN